MRHGGRGYGSKREKVGLTRNAEQQENCDIGESGGLSPISLIGDSLALNGVGYPPLKMTGFVIGVWI